MSRLRDAPIGEAVPDVDEPVRAGEIRALARLATHVADRLLPEDGSPPLRPRVEPIGDDADADPVAREQRVDQLVESHGHDERVVALDDLGEPGSERHRFEQERDHLLDGALIVAISTAMTSCRVRRRPISSSIARKTSTSPNSAIAACSVSPSVTVPSQSSTSVGGMSVLIPPSAPRRAEVGTMSP